MLGSSSLLGIQPGGAENDIVTIALFLSAAALLLHAEGRKGPLVLAAVAAGLALGTKVTMIARSFCWERVS